jgi:VanZ family protein
VIFGFSSVPGSNIPGGYSQYGHLGEYFVLGLLLTLALRPGRSPRAAFLLAVVIASAYGVTDEFHQRFVFMRTPDVVDWMLDTVGAFVAAAAATLLLRWRGRSRRETDPNENGRP